jgi:PKHD-type hydroxylase
MWGLTSHTFENWAYAENAFSKEECEEIVELSNNYAKTEATVGQDVTIEHEVRKTTVAWIHYEGHPEAEWLYRKLTDYVNSLNKQFWEFDLNKIEPLQYTSYKDIGDHYQPHIDCFKTGADQRKLSFSLQLTDPEEYDGGELLFLPNSVESEVAPKGQGTLILFPSFIMHQVTPMERGERNSLVGWVRGPFFK